MRNIAPDGLFNRIFALLIAIIIASHLSMIVSLIYAGQDALMPEGSVQVVDNTVPAVIMVNPALVVWQALKDVWPTVCGMFFLVILTAWLGAKMLAAPLRRLSEAAVNLGKNLDSPPMPESGPYEAKLAARVFNRLQDRIRGQIQQRSVFLAAVSHDLRTPLTRMKLRVERMEEDELKRKLRKDLDEMTTMLNATLEFLRGEAESESWQMLDIQALAESLAEDAVETGGAVTVSGEARPLMAQPTILRRCLSNLIENALRYGHSARVVLKDGPGTLVIEVEDDGPGIPEDQLAAVFEPFVRLESSRNKGSGGVGLGLSIAREAALRHGGDLNLRNASAGGLVARLSIPRNP